jgi:hypothetical protein
MSITFNPNLTTAPSGNFLASTQGYFQGDFVDDPSTRMELAAGQIASSVSQPLWGGMALTESVPSAGESALGSSLTLASSAGNLTGFSVFTQGYNGVIVPGNSVQLYAPGQTLNFFRLGSGARIKVAVLASEVASLEGGAVNQTLYWDPSLQQLTASGTSGAITLPSGVLVLSVNTNSKVVSYSSGVASWAAGAVAVIKI